MKWNSASGDPFANGTINCIPSNHCVIDAFGFAIDDLTSTGPHDIHIHIIQNGATTFYAFEEAPAGQTDFGFRAPGFSGTTSGSLAGSPNSSAVVNRVTYEGTKSIRCQWAWNGTTATKWVWEIR